jgi:hypothetical protein
MSAGTYYLDQGNLTINGNATLTGTNVTIVFTSSSGNNYATASVNGGAVVNLTPPTTGATAGIVLVGDRNMPRGTSFSLNGLLRRDVPAESRRILCGQQWFIERLRTIDRRHHCVNGQLEFRHQLCVHRNKANRVRGGKARRMRWRC